MPGDADVRTPAQVLGQLRSDGQRPHDRHGAELVGRGGDGVAPAREHAGGVLDRVGDVEREDLGPERVQGQLERGCDAEVAAAAADRPVQVGVLIGAGADSPAVGEDELGGDEVVDRHPVQPALGGHATAQREPGHAGLRHDAAGRREPERLRDAIHVGPGGPALHVHGAPRVVDPDRAHRREVDDDAVVDDGGARDVVSAAADGERELLRGGEADGVGDVFGVRAADDHGGALVDHAVPDPACGLVRGVVRGDDVAGEALGERRQCGWADEDDRLYGHGCISWKGRLGASTVPPARKATVRPA
jgi:hypothetical protein